MSAKQFLVSLLPDSLQGRLLYHFRPALRQPWGGPFNGQDGRRAIFDSLVKNFAPEAIVETGTFRGDTTRYMAGRCAAPVYTAEFDARNVGFASENLRGLSNVRISHGDSRAFLDNLRLPQSRVFFYLDAHWGEDLPLAEEIRIIFEKTPVPLVMIDDFKVPGDAGYGYDDYGAGSALIPEYIEALCSRFGMSQFYPALPSALETGARRGCVLLAADPAVVATLAADPLLKKPPLHS
ncbi:MAG: hypothetical protein K2X62_04185 [Beijerinckiaceae bacterium]|jgi:predicted O-methyltransferase YrrM|nr:hypothetical protein [Beijerinckiaceae bacterium]